MHHLTYEEVIGTYHYTVLSKLIKREFPWIKKVFLKSNRDVNRYSIIFLDVEIDPWQLAKEKDFMVIWYMINYTSEGYGFLRETDFYSPYLSSFYAGNIEPVREVASQVENVIKKVATTPAIPDEYKLPRGRTFSIGSWYLWKQSIVLPEYTQEYTPPTPDK